MSFKKQLIKSLCSGLITAVTVTIAPAILSSEAEAAKCVEFYQHANFKGKKWSWCGKRPNFKDWNDEVSSIIVPEGKIIAVYEHTKKKGKSTLFEGRVSYVGKDFNDKISSWKTVTGSLSNCVRAYKDTSYKGTVWYFCPSSYGLPKADHSKWNDQISSVKLPSGKYAKFCVDLGHSGGKPVGKTLCRTYFKNTANVGSTLNDKFSFLKWGSFNKNNFVMAMISDPQIGYCVASACKNGPKTTKKANEWHSKSIEKLANSTSSFAGVVVNGDITNTIDKDQLETYQNLYEKKLLNLYVGLGNHDYDNYYPKWCAGEGNAVSKNYCTRRLLETFDKHVKSIPTVRYDLSKGKWNRDGSYAYSWDIGNYHFIQLNNYPSFKLKFSSYISSRVGSEKFNIKKSLDWLEADIKATSSNKKIVINMHSLYASAFNSSGGKTRPKDKDWYKLSESERSTNTAADYTRFLKILDKHPKVVAVFAGHLHDRIGRSTDLTSGAGKKVPVYFTGAAEYNHYLKVTYKPNQMVIQPINSTNGKVTNKGSADTINF